MLGLWVFSVLYVLVYVPARSSSGIGMGSGAFGLVEHYGQFSQGWTCNPSHLNWKNFATQMPWTTFVYHFLGFRLPTIDRGFVVPVWLFVVAVGFPTAVLWWRDRRPKAGFCKACKYDLTGNVSGRCPECGTPVGKLR